MNCKYCGKLTPIWGSKNKKYCNLKCQRAYEAKIDKIIFDDKECAICLKKFTPVSRLNKYCSYKCKHIAELAARSKKPYIKNCKQCFKEFNPYTSLDKFCSANCRVEHLKSKRTRRWNPEKVKKILGKNNPAYRNGLYARGAKKSAIGQRLFQSNAKEYRQDIINRYGYLFCENCKASGNIKLEAHHIVYRSEKPLHEHLHDKGNILLVCVKCHNKFHSHKSLRNSIVRQRKLYELFGNDILDK